MLLKFAAPSAAQENQGLNPQPERAAAFGGNLPIEDGKLVPYVGTVETLPVEPSEEQVETIRQAYEEDGAILVPNEKTKGSKPLILVIDTPTKVTKVSRKYTDRFHIERIVLDDSLITQFQRGSNNYCAMMKMCFYEFDDAPLKFARILAPMAAATAALKGITHPTSISIGTLTVHPALFAVWQTMFMMGYTYFKSRYSPGIERWFAYTTLENPTLIQRITGAAGFFAKNYAFDISASLMINFAMGSPNQWWEVIASSVTLDILGNVYGTLRKSLIDRAIKEYPEYEESIENNRGMVNLADKTIMTPISLVMRSAFSLGLVGKSVPMIGGLALYSGMSLYRLIRGPKGVLAEVKSDSAVRRLNQFEKNARRVWRGLLEMTFASCTTLFSPENLDLVEPAIQYFDVRFARPVKNP